MQRFHYRALGGGGELLKGVSDGPNAAEVTARLQKRGAMVLAVNPAGR